MLVHNGTKVLSQGNLLFEWLLATEEQTATIFETISDQDDEASFKAMSSYFFKELRSNTSKLIKRVAILKLDE